MKNPAGTVTLFSFDAGQGLSEHPAPFDALVQVLDGHARLSFGGRVVEIQAGATVLMPARRLLTAEDQSELSHAFEKVEAEELGEGVHEKYHRLAHDFSKR